MACTIHQTCTTHAGLLGELAGTPNDFKSCTFRVGPDATVGLTAAIPSEEERGLRAVDAGVIGETDFQIAAWGE